MKTIDITGHKFGMLTVISKCHKKDKNGKSLWLCLCDCGLQNVVRWNPLVHGKVKSCGCTHYTHRMWKDPVSKSWQCMLNRCYREKDVAHHRYGGIGIKVCEFLRASPSNIKAIIGPRAIGTTIDRINGNAHYSCGTCAECLASGWALNIRWSTTETQNRNRRCARMATIMGHKRHIFDWAETFGLSKAIVTGRWLMGRRDEALFK